MLALAVVQASQQHALAAEQVGQGRVRPRRALIGERDQHAPLVPRVGLPANQALAHQPVDPVGHGARRHQGGAEQRTGRQLERRALPAQRGEHVELPCLEPMVGERAAPRDVQVPGEPGDPAEHLHRLDVEVRTLGLPRGHQLIYLVPQHGSLEELGVGVVSIARGDGSTSARRDSIPPDPPGRPPRKGDAGAGALGHS
jgi:hypothetical protein